MNPTPSPFKFLEPFTFADRKNFFGRDKEVETLYRVVQRTPLLLLYGLSGTGKTSLVQCGLAARFDGPDWLPLWIRREDDFVRSLHKEIDGAFTTPVPAGAGAPEKIQALYRQYLRPVFLLFDQFEELFILGDATERNAFVGEIKNILKAGLPCTILLIIREEYLGRLYPLEKDIPNLFDFRMRVESMDTTNVTKVLTDSFANFNIQLEAPAETRIGEIITNIRLKDTPVELPHLQVYLDRLYREDFARTYPNGADSPEGAWPPLEFTKAEIADFGTIENVLDEFLREQRRLIQEQFEKNFPSESGTEYAVDRVLAAFVSAEGTKRPISVAEEAGGLVIAPRQRDLFPALSPEALSWCIKQLAQSRILHSSGASYELTHDTLATAVERQQNAEQKQLSEARHRIELGYKNHLDTNGQSFIDQAMLIRLEPLLPKLDLPKEWAEFVENSIKEVKRQADLENERQRQERERIRRGKRRNLVVGLLAFALLGFAFWQMKAAGDAVELAEQKTHAAELSDSLAGIEKRNADTATGLALAAKNEAAQKEKEAATAQAAARIAEIKAQDAIKQSGVDSEKARLAAIEAEQKKQEAIEATQVAENAKLEALKAAEQGVVAMLTVANNAIKQLNYTEASEAVNAAVRLEAGKPEVANALLEMAFFHNHTGDWKIAAKETATAARWLGKPELATQAERVGSGNALRALRRLQETLAPARFADLDSLYFPKMVDIKGGTFIPGCIKSEDCEEKDSLYQATLSDYQLAQTETTVFQYHLYTTALGRRIGQRITPADTLEEYDPPTWGWVYDHPIINVSWYDAVEYANWASEQQGFTPVYDIVKTERDPDNQHSGDQYGWLVRIREAANGYRLPTEAEWEFAARGGVRQDTFQNASGSDDLDEVAWSYSNSGSRTHTVGGKKPNSLQLYDLSGNVWEWCWDWYGDYPEKPETNYRGASSGSSRVLRGGSWYDDGFIDRLALRNRIYPIDRDYYVCGFRVARH